jgi:transposase
MKNNIQSKKTKPAKLSALNPECAGIDIGASELFVCIANKSLEHEVRSFPTFTADLQAIIRWLQENKIKSVAMESTGVYRIVPYEMLEDAGFEVVLINARFFKNVPGRKSDVQDCQWIQQLHSYGLLRGSFRPSNEVVELRSYVRQRSRLFKSAATQIQLMQKALTQMNIQLNHVISDITGMTGLNIIKAILEGKRNPKELSDLSVGACKKNKALIEKALNGFDTRSVLKKNVKIDLTAIPGIDGSSAIKILSEIGTDMSRWPTAKAFVSWLGLSPGNKISGGKVSSFQV